ncbi:hypothetical protein [Chryseobacterium sp. JUb7]|uniref:hypothetical protein n=1 Tax=Chryseobacterium sp. JUb7 TaxID=2940599 RepID=UPI00216753E9|nr:hypothetical protein [Chryseobacterium sp. JUb7]MCS3529578.1 hypothetical protein [Chryseobacterium sp. JUb7]
MKFIKKLLKAIAISLVLLIGSVLLFIILIKKMPEGEYSKLDPTDKKMFDELTLQYKTFHEKPDQIWTSSYHYDQEPLIVIRSQKNKFIWRYIYLINASKYINTKKFKKINFPGNPYLKDVYAATSLGNLSGEYWFPGAFTYSFLKDKNVLAFKYYPELFEKEGSFPDFKYFSMHEAFHIYAQKDWTYDKEGKDHITNYPFNKEHFDLLRKEYSLLDKGLKTSDTTELNMIMKEWVKIRKKRYKKWPQLINETNSEAIEGTARYIEYKYSDLIGKTRPFITDNSGKVISFSQGLEMILKDKANYSFLTRTASYDKGAALGYILDKLDPLWKNKIEDSPSHKGLTPYEILKIRY